MLQTLVPPDATSEFLKYGFALGSLSRDPFLSDQQLTHDRYRDITKFDMRWTTRTCGRHGLCNG